MPAWRWLSRWKDVGRQFRQIRTVIILRSDSKLYLYSEVANTMLPGKASKQ